LHRQQPENDKQKFDVAPPGKISADAHVQERTKFPQMLHWNRMTCGALCLRWKKFVGLFFEQKEITSGHCVFLGEKSLE